jgi:hypothetical protein
LGGLYIAIMYNASGALSLKNAMINSALEFVIIVFFLSMTQFVVVSCALLKWCFEQLFMSSSINCVILVEAKHCMKVC